MKKLIALLLALALTMVSFAAFAAPSKSGEDITEVIVDPEHPGAPDGPAFFIAISDDPSDIAWANAELAKMTAAESVQAYFGQEKEIAALLGDPDYQVNEFWPIIAGNYDKAMGNVTAKFYFATPYESGAKVAVMIGFGKEEDVIWTTFAGNVLDDGAIQAVLDPDTVMNIQNNGALLAIVNK